METSPRPTRRRLPRTHHPPSLTTAYTKQLTSSFVAQARGSASIDEKGIERARMLVGLKGYVTNIPKHLMPASEVITSYHDLWHVEQSFRMSKTDLKARPVFHHTRDAIEAHLTVVITALAVARHLQTRTGMSIKNLVRTLRPLQEITIRIGNHTATAADPLNDTARRILTSLHIDPTP
ncbi:IS1634 family transposase [Actinomyces culturomici]|uniref:IS1634 family transposase n=1 Tax=Actinomyces culturomici TaxID=1926276 RepID=UPI002E263AFC